MNPPAPHRPHTIDRTRRSAGRVSPRLLAGLLLVGVAVGAVVYLAVDRFGNDEQRTRDPGPSPEQITAELEALQNELNTAMHEPQALPRIEARALDFTRRHPGDARGQLLLAQTRLRQSKWGPAYEALTRALASQPNAVELNRLAGDCAAKLGRLDQAEAHYRAAVTTAGDAADSDMHAAMGRLYLALNKPDPAEDAFHNSIKARHARGEETNWRHKGYSGLADVAAMRGDFDTALQHIDKALQFANSDSTADVTGYRIQKARLYMDAGQDEDATTMLAFTWGESPDAQWRIESARLRAKLYERADQLDKAVKHVETVCNIYQTSPERKNDELANFYALLAEWQIKAGQTDAARIALDNAETLWPDQPRIQSLRGRLK